METEIQFSFSSYLSAIVKHIVEKLNYGHKESVYQLALCYELEGKGYKVQREVIKDIVYEYFILGNIRADIIINDQYIIEMKSVTKITDKETNQLVRYLEIFNMQTGYLININYKNYEIIRVEGKKRFDPVSM